MKEFVNGGYNEKDQFFFAFKLSFARMVIKCEFGRPKGRFGCLRKKMDIDIEDLPYVIHACVLLHNFCELHKKPAHQNLVEATKKYDIELKTNKSLDIKQVMMKVQEKKLEEYFKKCIK